MNARPWRTWVMGALLALAILPPARSATATLSSFPDIRQVADRGALRVGLVAKDIPPLLVTGSDGQPAGIEVAMANGLARRLQVKLQFVRTAATHDALVVHKTGFIKRRTFEMSLDKVESVDVNQSILGRLMNYGNLTIQGVGEGTETISTISSPLAFRNAITTRSVGT